MKKLLKVLFIFGLYIAGGKLMGSDDLGDLTVEQKEFVPGKRIVCVEEITTLEDEPIANSSELSEQERAQLDKDIEELTKELEAMNPQELNSFMDQVLADPSTQIENLDTLSD